MAHEPVRPDAQRRGQILLVIHNNHPISAEELARIYADLAKDYRRITKQDLYVYRVSEGSIWTWFHDMSPLLSDLSTAGKFIKTIGDLIILAKKGGPAALNLFKGKTAGTNTVENLMRVASSIKGDVQLSYERKKDEEKFNLKITPVIANSVLPTIQHARELRSHQTISSQAGATTKLVQLDSGDLSLPKLATRIAQLKASSPSDEISAIESILNALVKSLVDEGGRVVLEKVIQKLGAEGNIAAAQVIRGAVALATSES